MTTVEINPRVVVPLGDTPTLGTVLAHCPAQGGWTVRVDADGRTYSFSYCEIDWEAGAAHSHLADEARAWLAEVEWPDLDREEALQLPDEHAIAAIARHYDGGLAAFIADGAVA